MLGSLKNWNLLRPSRRISRLEHIDGTTSIEVKMIPGMATAILHIFAIYELVAVAALKRVPGVFVMLVTMEHWSPILAAPLTLVLFVLCGAFALMFALSGWQLFAGTETLTIENDATRYENKALKNRNRIGPTQSIKHLRTSGGLQGYPIPIFFDYHFGLTADMSGQSLEVGSGLQEDEATKLLAFIFDHHPELRERSLPTSASNPN